MRLKILTVDDSKAVRIIVKKAFTSYDVDIVEASNGVEGLAAAAKENPDVVLLDVTMPVMDGVEMLTKMKSDPVLKPIPVVMLTAEAGRENVLKIAKIGIRDYIVKPFKEEVLIEKVSRILDLRPLGDAVNKRKGITDKCEILVVEDKPAIIKQIQDGLAHTPWTVNGVASTGEAVDFCQKVVPDLIIISLSLPDEAAPTLFRILRSNMKTKYVPVFGLAVKTAVEDQQAAQQLGFTSVITKPIDFTELEARVAKAVNLDTSERYFTFDEDFLIIRLPENSSTTIINEVVGYLKPKISSAVDNGFYKVIIDVHALKNLNMAIIKLLVQTMALCQELTLTFSLVGNPQISAECKGFEESKDWTFFSSVDQAKAAVKAAVR